MNRRSLIAIVALVLVGGLFLSRTMHLGSTAHASVESQPQPAPLVVSNPANSSNPVAALPATSSGEPERATTSKPTESPAPTPQAINGVSDIDPHKAFGSKSAPVTMEVFSDFQCPACKTLFMTTNRQLMDNYVSTGKVYLIHRDYPLPMHAYSRVAARYARAASQIGKFEQVEQTLFENQEKWEQNGDVDGTLAAVLSAADMAKVRALVKGGTMDAAIDKDAALGQMYRVNQTPTTVFHNKGQTIPYAGVMGYDILKQFLDQLLGQK